MLVYIKVYYGLFRGKFRQFIIFLCEIFDRFVILFIYLDGLAFTMKLNLWFIKFDVCDIVFTIFLTCIYLIYFSSVKWNIVDIIDFVFRIQWLIIFSLHCACHFLIGNISWKKNTKISRYLPTIQITFAGLFSLEASPVWANYGPRHCFK